MKLLLLAGTAEARELADRLAQDKRFEVTASLAGATRKPLPLGGRTRIGGFGGEDEQEKYIKETGFEAILDATHPFAVQISRRTQAISARLALPYLQLLRPGWQPGPGDEWRFVDRPEELAEHLPEGAVVFLAMGRNMLPKLENLSDHRLFCRVVDAPEVPFPFPRGEYVIGRPPFTVESEKALFRRLGITHLVVKDAGGSASAKLEAARALGLPVIVIRRPDQPPGEKAASVENALAWLERLL